MKNMEGQRVPDVTFRTRRLSDWEDLTTADTFAGKRVVVFALPGAFTPTCSSAHVPRYNELAPAFKARGVDGVVCVAVNDGFVMEEWGRAQNAEHITFLPDGNGAFAQGMGMLVDKRHLGFGQRSWRYSMLVVDGVIEKMFVEPEIDGDPFTVSDADTMLDYLAPGAKAPASVLLIGRPGCSHCVRAKAILSANGLVYEEVLATPRNLRAVSGKTTTPQIFIDGDHIGGADELASLFPSSS